uniref:Uncharacterized protein n=1 Tax=Craspedostauros australis TaxID=1486917 RepID=A0A7R9ZLN1_9STRA
MANWRNARSSLRQAFIRGMPAETQPFLHGTWSQDGRWRRLAHLDMLQFLQHREMLPLRGDLSSCPFVHVCGSDALVIDFLVNNIVGLFILFAIALAFSACKQLPAI